MICFTDFIFRSLRFRQGREGGRVSGQVEPLCLVHLFYMRHRAFNHLAQRRQVDVLQTLDVEARFAVFNVAELFQQRFVSVGVGHDIDRYFTFAG